MRTSEERFFAKTYPFISEKGCLLWIGALNKPHGYGQFRINKKTEFVHRFAYKYWIGPIPNGLFVCHHCDNPSCVCPDHLFLGTTQDNTKDRENKNRGCRGENHPKAKLTRNQVLKIRELYAIGSIGKKRLAEKFLISRRQVSDIVTNKKWKNL